MVYCRNWLITEDLLGIRNQVCRGYDMVDPKPYRIPHTHTFIDRNHVTHPIPDICDHASGAARGVQGQHRLDADIQCWGRGEEDGGDPEQAVVRVQCKVGRQRWGTAGGRCTRMGVVKVITWLKPSTLLAPE